MRSDLPPKSHGSGLVSRLRLRAGLRNALLLLSAIAAPFLSPAQSSPNQSSPTQPATKQPWAIAIHGGAGEAEWLSIDAPTAAAYHASLARALAAGAAVLQKHGTALDAV